VFFFIIMIRLPQRPTLFPYTTLFRSSNTSVPRVHAVAAAMLACTGRDTALAVTVSCSPADRKLTSCFRSGRGFSPDRTGREKTRSEEHTSELQSRGHLVCRLLLEKKK